MNFDNFVKLRNPENGRINYIDPEKIIRIASHFDSNEIGTMIYLDGVRDYVYIGMEITKVMKQLNPPKSVPVDNSQQIENYKRIIVWLDRWLALPGVSIHFNEMKMVKTELAAIILKLDVKPLKASEPIQRRITLTE